jgi:hypothetical protein
MKKMQQLYFKKMWMLLPVDHSRQSRRLNVDNPRQTWNDTTSKPALFRIEVYLSSYRVSS